MTVKIGFIGVGGIAQVHLKNIAQIKDAELVSVSDLNFERAKEVAQEYGVRGYADHVQMLDQEKLDAVYICVPPFAHGEVEISVIERGIPLFVEKPLGIDINPVYKIYQMIQDKGLLTSVGYHWRYSEAANLAKKAMEGHVPGMAQGYWLGGMPMVPWWRKMEGSGGQIIEQTTHIIDLSRYLLGDVVEVYASYSHREMQDLVEGTTVPDVGTAVLKFENGCIATITNTCLLDQGYTVGLDILSREAIWEVRSDSLIERRKEQTVKTKNQNNPYLVEDIAFIEAVKTGDKKGIRSSYEDAYLTHLVTIAANESAASGKPIKL